MKKFVNILTLMRIFATFLLPFLWRVLNPTILLIFVVLILFTDFFDGLLARTFHVQSIFGTVMDVVADKCFGIMIILILSTYDVVFVLPLVLEIGITLINILGYAFGAVSKAYYLGKVKMWFLGVAIFFGILKIYKDGIIDIMQVKFLNDLFTVLIANVDNLIYSSIFLTAGSEFMVAVDYSIHIMKDIEKRPENNTKKKKVKTKKKLKSHDELMYILFDTEYCLKHRDEPLAEQLVEK